MLDEFINHKPSDYEVITDWDSNVSIRRSDGASIPPDPRNKDYYEFLQVEKTDTKGEIKRTSIPKPEPVENPISMLEKRITSLESDVSVLKSKVK